MSSRLCTTIRDDFVALIDGALDLSREQEISAHVAACDECGVELDFVSQIARDFESLGDAVVANAPEIDIIDSVMAAVQDLESRPADSESVVPFEPPVRTPATKSQSKRYGWFLGAAAAAGIAVALGWVAFDSLVTRPETDTTMTANNQNQETDRESTATTPAPDEPARRPDIQRDAMPRPVEIETVERAEVIIPEVETIASAFVRAHREKDGSLDELAGWASLAREQAEQIFESPDASLEAKVGASIFLDDADASVQLMTAVGQVPDDPYVRLKAAQHASSPAASAENLNALRQIDPQNALVDYYDALRLFREGDIEGALAALERARAKDAALAYALLGAQYREEALVAGGVSAENARMLAALTAGQNEYLELTGLARELMAFGEQFESAGDYETALRIYEAITNMGRQISGSAKLSQEQTAGFDIQWEALNAMDALAGSGATNDVQSLLNSIDSPLDIAIVWAELELGLDGLTSFVDSLLANLSGSPESTVETANEIMQNGDLIFPPAQ